MQFWNQEAADCWDRGRLARTVSQARNFVLDKGLSRFALSAGETPAIPVFRANLRNKDLGLWTLGLGPWTLSALLHPGVISRRSINRRDLSAHGSEIRAQLPTMMDSVEHEVPKKFHRWSFHYDVSLIKKLCISLLPSIIKRGNLVV